MDKKQEIEKMAMVISPFGYCMGSPCSECQSIKPKKCSYYDTAQKLISAGYGNISQALREFADVLEEKCMERAKRGTFSLVGCKDIEELLEKMLKEGGNR